jgi:membrane fusion protein, multidrug efflux system
MTRILINTALTVTIVAGAILSGCEKSQPPVLEPRVRPVRTVSVAETPKELVRRFAGGSQAAVSTTISFRINGIITEMPVKVGQGLQQGQLIARLNDQDLKLSLAKDEASLQQELIQSENASSQFKQFQNLYTRQLVSRKEFESAETSFNTAQAQVEQSRRTFEISQQQLSYSQLHSPAGGCMVSEVHSSVSENVSTGQSIATLNCGTSIEVVVAVPENSIAGITIGDSATVEFPSMKNREFAAKVTEVGTPGENGSAYPVTLRLNNEGALLRPGMAAEVSFRFLHNRKAENLWIPLLAAGKEGDEIFVYVFEPSDQNQGVVRRRVVKTGVFTLEEVEVLEGLQVGEQIITAGLSQIHDGLTVKLLAESGSK